MKTCDLAATISAIACCLVENKTKEEVECLSAIFLMLGQTLESMITYQDSCSHEKRKC